MILWLFLYLLSCPKIKKTFNFYYTFVLDSWHFWNSEVAWQHSIAFHSSPQRYFVMAAISAMSAAYTGFSGGPFEHGPTICVTASSILEDCLTVLVHGSENIEDGLAICVSGSTSFIRKAQLCLKMGWPFVWIAQALLSNTWPFVCMAQTFVWVAQAFLCMLRHFCERPFENSGSSIFEYTVWLNRFCAWVDHLSRAQKYVWLAQAF